MSFSLLPLFYVAENPLYIYYYNELLSKSVYILSSCLEPQGVEVIGAENCQNIQQDSLSSNEFI